MSPTAHRLHVATIDAHVAAARLERDADIHHDAAFYADVLRSRYAEADALCEESRRLVMATWADAAKASAELRKAKLGAGR